ncbi:MraY family glycosyltransferase [Halopseudomonas pelagia]|uniref:Glycosyl transferase n=1 Tax=Halopseudomonas pelagia TaxID=553151 RepID=A0AA91Z580_9GAMM|nr:glycosyltransferase family 4 protein [Halopseudomonas pelagia]PCC98446.1 glycosyl transferase [Halopseudomonas pelagia]QFY58874.1 glycosyltransferase family 4 protein [Halopseudomonas pelagia]
MTWLLLIVAIAVITFLLTFVLRRYALATSMIDVPNARSSHSIPTPRGGGVAIVIVFLLVLVYLFFQDGPEQRIVIALGGGGLVIALVGFLDDHGHIAARWRLLAHFAGAGWALFWLPGAPPLHLLGMTLTSPWIVYPLVGLFLVWLLNLYNFMDGIDGLASVEAITVCVGGALIYWFMGYPERMILPLALAASVAGFLVWNFPPARIFMGDAGSGFLGIALGVLTLAAALVEPQLLSSWLILLGVFIADATFTLMRRLIRGDKVYEAHRSHAYQYASRKYGSHLPVTLAVLAVNLLWLLPWACFVALGHVDALLGLMIAYAPLAILAVVFKAGELEVPE